MLNLRDRIDILIRILFGSAIAIGCYFVVRPFLTAITIAAIVTVVSWPLFARFKTNMGNRPTPAAFLMVTLLVVCLIIPMMFLSAAVAQQLPSAISGITEYIRTISAPLWLKEIPVIGTWLYSQMAIVFQPQALADLMRKMIDPITREVFTIALSLGNGLVQMALVAFIAFFFYRDGQSLARRLRLSLNKISGDLAKEYTDILVNTTRSVVFGVIGTAIGQGLVAAVGFLIADVPGVVMLSFAVCVLSVVPVGPPLVWGPVALWLFSTGQTGWAVFMVFWGVLAVSSVDNFIKPILISRGTTLPLALVFLGVLGGIMTFGMLGLVLGPILLSASIAMFQSWLKNPVRRKAAEKSLAAADAGNSAGDSKTTLPEPEADKNSENVS